jgi:hypothetical protein
MPGDANDTLVLDGEARRAAARDTPNRRSVEIFSIPSHARAIMPQYLRLIYCAHYIEQDARARHDIRTTSANNIMLPISAVGPEFAAS